MKKLVSVLAISVVFSSLVISSPATATPLTSISGKSGGGGTCC